MLITVQTGLSGCQLLEWEERPLTPGVETAPVQTISVLINTKGTGAFRIYKKGNNRRFEYLGGVGEDAKLVMIDWNPEWVYFCSGTLRFRYVTKQE